MAESITDSIRETSRDYRHPYRPVPLGLVNSIGRKLEDLRILRPLESAKIFQAAAGQSTSETRAAKTDRESDTGIREALRVLVESIETEARLNPVGRMIIRRRLIGVLKARFHAEQLLRQQPEILSKPLSQPIVITGLQRTGTTLLHRLLANDRRFRSLASWEVLDPVPPTGSQTDKRKKTARTAEKGAAWMAPDFFAVHPIDHKAPEEDVLLLDLSLRSTVAEAILNVPSYSAWLENEDSTEAYVFMRQLLLIFQEQHTRPYWVLKSPHHLEYLDTLFKVFPEVKVIQTHRDPAVTTGSFLSMVAHGYGMFSDSPDPMEIGRHWMRKCRRMVERGMAFRDSLPKVFERKRFLDLSFYELTTKPLDALDKVYRFSGIDFDSRAQTDAMEFLGENTRNRFGRHCYQLSDFGFNTDAVREDYKKYRDRYSIPDED